jgi:hypothetical protein
MDFYTATAKYLVLAKLHYQIKFITDYSPDLVIQFEETPIKTNAHPSNFYRLFWYFFTLNFFDNFHNKSNTSFNFYKSQFGFFDYRL